MRQINYVDEGSNCCGCSACYDICPYNAIKMVENQDGFMYPHIVSDLCRNCGLCQTVCPLKNNKKYNTLAAYATQNINSDELYFASSGGFFQVLSQYVISLGGYVAGVVYNHEWVPTYLISNKSEDLRKFSGSKYAQADARELHRSIKELLVQGKMVLFSGTPCQVSALKCYLKEEYEKLITVDLVCRGLPSSKLWKQYLEFQKQQYKANIVYVNQRDKSFGYHHGVMKIIFDNKKQYVGGVGVDLFSKAFHDDLCSRESCYKCQFRGFSRSSDFTLFDCWKPQELNSSIIDNDRGYTAVLLHTIKAFDYFELIKNRMNAVQIDAKEAEAYTGGILSDSAIRPKGRDIFYELNQMYGLKGALKRLSPIKCIDRLKFAIKRVLNKVGLLIYKR